MKKFFLILFFLCLAYPVCVFSEEIEINSEVLTVRPTLEFFIIKAGEGSGIEIGDGLIVHRKGEKIAEAYIIEVRPDVSAAEILKVTSGRRIEEGDGILIVKERASGEESAYAEIPSIIEKGDVVSIVINRDFKTVFGYARLVLRENGYSIVSSDRTAGILLATKPIALSLIKELWADAFAAIDHKTVVSLDIKDENRRSKLRISSFREHSQKGKHVKRPVTKDSKYYSELVELVSKIKERSEY